MKNKFIIFSLLLAVSGNCQTYKSLSNGSNSETMQASNDIDSVETSLPVYNVDSCLLSLFEAIVEGDKNSSYFEADKIFYSINLEDHKNYISMDVWPMRWNKTAYFDYFGISKIKGMQFLFRGDYKNDTLYHRLEEKLVKVKLQRPKINRVDDIDKSIDSLFLNPTLRGKYLDCNGLTIYCEVYIKGSIPDFHMESSNAK